MKKFLVLFLVMLMLSSMAFAGTRDRNIDWTKEVKFIPAQSFTGYTTVTGVADGSPTISEISNVGLTGMRAIADGNSMSTFFDIQGVDVAQPVYTRVLWTTSVATTAAVDRQVTWKVVYDNIVTASTDVPTAIIAPATALDTTIGLSTAETSTAYVLNRTKWGKINGNKFSSGNLAAFNVECDSASFVYPTTNEVYMIGLEIKYTPKKTEGSGMNREAK